MLLFLYFKDFFWLLYLWKKIIYDVQKHCPHIDYIFSYSSFFPSALTMINLSFFFIANFILASHIFGYAILIYLWVV